MRDDDDDDAEERVEMDARLVRGTEDALLLEYTDGNGNIAEDWFPRSQVEDLDVHADGMCSLTIPEWLAVIGASYDSLPNNRPQALDVHVPRTRGTAARTGPRREPHA